VLLLNTVLTVEQDRPGSHARRGWEALTDMLIDAVAERPVPTAFLLWGGHAQQKAGRVRAMACHGLWQANHPSPLSANRPPAPFVGCGHFGAAADFLAAHGRPVDWALATPGVGAGDRLGSPQNEI